jgi:hypothetical protein
MQTIQANNYPVYFNEKASSDNIVEFLKNAQNVVEEKR